MKQLTRLLVLVASVLGMATFAPGSSSPASAEMINCSITNLDATGARTVCGWGRSAKNRHRVRVNCTNATTVYGAPSLWYNTSTARCGGGSMRIARNIQFCENYYQSPTTSYCVTGWYTG